jgi:hypothetical protein
MIENLLFERTPPNHYFLAQVYHLSSTVTKKCQDGIRKQLKEVKLKFILAKHKNVFFFVEVWHWIFLLKRNFITE